MPWPVDVLLSALKYESNNFYITPTISLKRYKTRRLCLQKQSKKREARQHRNYIGVIIHPSNSTCYSRITNHQKHCKKDWRGDCITLTSWTTSISTTLMWMFFFAVCVHNGNLSPAITAPPPHHGQLTSYPPCRIPPICRSGPKAINGRDGHHGGLHAWWLT